MQAPSYVLIERLDGRHLDTSSCGRLEAKQAPEGSPQRPPMASFGQHLNKTPAGRRSRMEPRSEAIPRRFQNDRATANRCEKNQSRCFEGGRPRKDSVGVGFVAPCRKRAIPASIIAFDIEVNGAVRAALEPEARCRREKCPRDSPPESGACSNGVGAIERSFPPHLPGIALPCGDSSPAQPSSISGRSTWWRLGPIPDISRSRPTQRCRACPAATRAVGAFRRAFSSLRTSECSDGLSPGSPLAPVSRAAARVKPRDRAVLGRGGRIVCQNLQKGRKEKEKKKKHISSTVRRSRPASTT